MIEEQDPTLQPKVSQEPLQPATADPVERPPDLACELLFNQLQHTSTVALAAAGGVLTLLGTSFIDTTRKGGIIVSILAFGISAVAALLGQNEMVDALTDRKPFLKKVKQFRMIAFAALGAGVGAFIQFITTNLSR